MVKRTNQDAGYGEAGSAFLQHARLAPEHAGASAARRGGGAGVPGEGGPSRAVSGAAGPASNSNKRTAPAAPAEV